MLPYNTLSLVAEYLSPGDLVAFTRTCRRMRKAGDREGIWRQAFLSLFPHEISDFGFQWTYSEVSDLPWKSLCLQAVSLHHLWSTFDCTLTLSGLLYRQLCRELTAPELPFLQLRRSADTMDSFYLNLLHDSELETMDTDQDRTEFASVLNEKAFELYEEIGTNVDFQSLERASEGEKVGNTPTNSRILRLFSLFRGSIEHHCRSVYLVLSEASTPTDLLKGYNQYWAAYCVSIQSLTSTYQSLLDLLGEMAEAKLGGCSRPRVTVISIMTDIWLHEVYLNIKPRLEPASLAVFRDVMSTGKESYADALKLVMSDLMDISVTVDRCSDTTESDFTPGEPYQSLATTLTETGLSLLSSTTTDPFTLHKSYTQSVRLFRYIFAPCTLAVLDDRMLMQEKICARSYFQRQIKQVAMCKQPTEISVLSVALTYLLGLQSYTDTEAVMQTEGQSVWEYTHWLVSSLDPDYHDTYKRVTLTANQLLRPLDQVLPSPTIAF